MATSNPIKVLGYFPAWGIHAMKYQVANIPADRLTHVIYAFAGISPTADVVSINAADDKINFPQLIQLKQQHPNLATLISIGGPSNSASFSKVAASADLQTHFAQSAVQFMKQNGFDGIDIDWEFPTAAQKQLFTAMLRELRRQLDALGSLDRRHYLLTIAAPAGASNYANLELNVIPALLDWIGLESYDYSVPSSKIADFVAPLKLYDPAIQKHAASNVNASVQAYLQAGVPANKLVLGVRFVGTGWRGVANTNNGLYQPNQGPAPGTWDAGAAPSGSFGFADLEQNYIGKFSRFFHADAQVPWLFQPTAAIMISYEDPQSLTAKANYILANQLAGVMIWELSADDQKYTLLNALAGLLGTMPGPQPIPDQFDAEYLTTELAVRLAGRPAEGSRSSTDAAKVVWVDAGDEVLVHLDSVQARIAGSTLLVSVDLECDQTGRASLIVPFALGGADDNAGLVAVTDELPRGNGLLAARWGKALQAAIWASLLGLAQDHAAQSNGVPRMFAISPAAGQITLQAGPPLQAAGPMAVRQ